MEMRRKDREITDIEKIYDILCRCDTVNLGMKGGITAKYESVIGTGVAEIIDDNAGKVAAFKHMLEHYKHSGFPAESWRVKTDGIFRN